MFTWTGWGWLSFLLVPVAFGVGASVSNRFDGAAAVIAFSVAALAVGAAFHALAWALNAKPATGGRAWGEWHGAWNLPMQEWNFILVVLLLVVDAVWIGSLTRPLWGWLFLLGIVGLPIIALVATRDSQKAVRAVRHRLAADRGARRADPRLDHLADIFFASLERTLAAADDLEVEYETTAAAARSGAIGTVDYRTEVACPGCAGTGDASGALSTCATCRGAGQRRFRAFFGEVVCPACWGSGRAVMDPCGRCGGSGRGPGGTSASFQVPEAAQDGTRVRLAGRGRAGRHGRAGGDLYVTVRIPADERRTQPPAAAPRPGRASDPTMETLTDELLAYADRRRPDTVDLEQECGVRSANLVPGAALRYEYHTDVPCPRCGGSGAASGAPTACRTCSGRGGHEEKSLVGSLWSSCDRCDGMGTVVADPCPHCSGQGRLPGARTVTFTVPDGAHDGQGVRLAGYGRAGSRGRPAGDLIVRLRVTDP